MSMVSPSSRLSGRSSPAVGGRRAWGCLLPCPRAGSRHLIGPSGRSGLARNQPPVKSTKGRGEPQGRSFRTWDIPAIFSPSRSCRRVPSLCYNGNIIDNFPVVFPRPYSPAPRRPMDIHVSTLVYHIIRRFSYEKISHSCSASVSSPWWPACLPLPPPPWTTPTVYCNNAVLVDANYGEVLYDLDAYDKAYPASTTKVMTALLVVEAIEAGQLTPDTPVTAGSDPDGGHPLRQGLCRLQPEGGGDPAGGGAAVLPASPLRRRCGQRAGRGGGRLHRGLCGPHEPQGRGAGLSGHPLYQPLRRTQRRALLHRL